MKGYKPHSGDIYYIRDIYEGSIYFYMVESCDAHSCVVIALDRTRKNFVGEHFRCKLKKIDNVYKIKVGRLFASYCNF